MGSSPNTIDFSRLRLERLSKSFDLSNFDCGDKDLNEFLKEDALAYQDNFIAITTLMLYDGEIASFFSLICDSIRLSGKEKKKGELTTPFSIFPAIKVARLATCQGLQGNGFGTEAVKYCIGLARKLNSRADEGIACRFLTVDAYPHRIDWYERLGFIQNVKEDRRDAVSMRYDILPRE